MASLDNIQVQKQGICATCEHVLHAQYVLYPASQKTHLNGCMNSIKSRIFEKKRLKLIKPFQVKLFHMNMALQHFKTITHPSACNHPVKL